MAEIINFMEILKIFINGVVNALAVYFASKHVIERFGKKKQKKKMEKKQMSVAKKIFLMISVIVIIFFIVVLGILVVELMKQDHELRSFLKEKNATCETTKDIGGIPIVQKCSYLDMKCFVNDTIVDCETLGGGK